MLLIYCPGCRQRSLCGVRRVRAVWNLAPGVLAVTLACHCGNPVLVLTGRACSYP